MLIVSSISTEIYRPTILFHQHPARYLPTLIPSTAVATATNFALFSEHTPFHLTSLIAYSRSPCYWAGSCHCPRHTNANLILPDFSTPHPHFSLIVICYYYLSNYFRVGSRFPAPHPHCPCVLVEYDHTIDDLILANYHSWWTSNADWIITFSCFELFLVALFPFLGI